jgi:hypothetical protein
MEMEVLKAIFFNLVTTTPIFIVWAIGIVLALSRWRRHPRASQFTIVALIVMIVVTVATRIIYILLPMTMRSSGWSPTEMAIIYNVIGIGSTLIQAIAWAMILWAIFGWRDQSKKENLYPPAPPAFGDEPREQSATPGFTQR